MRLQFGLGRVRRVLSPLVFFKAAGKGPGSRGGRVVGHSKSGRPIYYVDKDRDVGGRAGFGRFSETRSGKTVHATDTGGEHEDAHREFTPDDHRDAAEAHEAAASMPTGLGEQYHRRQAAAHRESANEPLPPSGGMAERGRVLGKTKSGQPVHAGKGPPDTRGSEGPDTWSDRDHEDAAGLHVNALQAAGSGKDATSAHHRAWAQYHHGRANSIRRSKDDERRDAGTKDWSAEDHENAAQVHRHLLTEKGLSYHQAAHHQREIAYHDTARAKKKPGGG